MAGLEQITDYNEIERHLGVGIPGNVGEALEATGSQEGVKGVKALYTYERGGFILFDPPEIQMMPMKRFAEAMRDYEMQTSPVEPSPDVVHETGRLATAGFKPGLAPA